MASQHDASITMYLGSSVSLWVKMSKMLAHVVYCQHLLPRDLPSPLYGLRHPAFLIAPFQQWLSSCHSLKKAKFVECTTNLVRRFSHPSCGSSHLLQSYHKPF
ncbi:hypothetical protein AMECASPLE_011675 [Ameca splendens]|uniref:Uncharacterized protein n=1 Tax=Ameca splendens TaxID=208324 RepID=A0ABV0Z083_9TELE